MKLLLTSGGVSNPSIQRALVELLGTPIEECSALAIPTAQHGHSMCTPESLRGFIAGGRGAPMCDLPWRSVGVLELTALPSMDADRWVPWVQAADALLVDGGDATYLCHWLRESGLADLLPALTDTVWVGLSAGSMVMTPRIGEDFVSWTKADDDVTLGVVDFSIFPHLDHPDMPGNTLATAQRWHTAIGGGPAYVMDDDSAISVVEGAVEVISEGRWQHLPGPGGPATP